jgi:hypothetical protein
MKRNVGALMLLAALGGFGGCMSYEGAPPPSFIPGADGPCGPGSYMSSYRNSNKTGIDDAHGGAYQVTTVPNLLLPNGEGVPRSAPYATAQSAGEAAARAAFVSSVDPSLIQATDLVKKGKLGGEVMQAYYPTAGPTGPIMPEGGPPGAPNPFGPKPPGAVAAVGALTGGGPPFVVQRTSVRFMEPAGMRITWFTMEDGKAGFSAKYLEAPARYNFAQACIYRLKLSDIPNRPGLELYPTMEVVPCNARTSTFLAHSAVPVSFTPDDFAQAAAGNFVVKVVYLPDPQFQDLASTGPDIVVSSQLEPGVDPIAEAHKRGSILLILRLGNIDLEAPNTPPMDAPSPYLQRPPQAGPPGMGPQGMGPPGMGPQGMMLPGMAGPAAGPQIPYGAMNNKGMMPQGMMPPGMMPQGMMPPGMMPQGMMPPPPGMMPPPPGMFPPQGPGAAPSVPTNAQPPKPTGQTSQATNPASVSQAKFDPAQGSPVKSFFTWPFGKKDTDSQ